MVDYIWEVRYQAALTETEPVLLKAHIKKAREAMIKRLKVLDTDKHTSAQQEYRAIQDAHSQLKVIERLLSFPDDGVSSLVHDASLRTRIRDTHE